MKRTFFSIFIALFFLSIVPSFGQGFMRKVNDRRLILTGTLGSSSYFGDLVSNMPYNNFGANFTVGVRKNIYPRISLGLEGGVVSLSGEDVHEERGLSFSSINYELVGLIEVSLFADPKLHYSRKLINPYINFGVGALYYQPKATRNGTTYNLADFETNGEKYTPVTVILPAGVGMKVKVADELDLALEFAFRMTFTDYLDDISGPGFPSWDYFNKFNEEAEIARMLSYGNRYPEINRMIKDSTNPLDPSTPIDPSIIPPRGNTSKHDFYMMTMVRAYYYLSLGKHKKSKKKRGFIKRKRFR